MQTSRGMNGSLFRDPRKVSIPPSSLPLEKKIPAHSYVKDGKPATHLDSFL